MPNKILLLACSSGKHPAIEYLSAEKRYTGTLFRSGLIYGKENNLKILILSAKYGFIEPETEIDNYNEKFKKPYSGPFPEGSGFYLGGPLYFKNAPDRFQSLVPKDLRIGEMNSRVQAMLKDPGLKCGIGVTAEIYKCLISRPFTEKELLDHLIALFPEREKEKMLQTIKTQCRQIRIGKERKCIFHKDNNLMWLEKC